MEVHPALFLVAKPLSKPVTYYDAILGYVAAISDCILVKVWRKQT